MSMRSATRTPEALLTTLHSEKNTIVTDMLIVKHDSNRLIHTIGRTTDHYMNQCNEP